MSHAAQIKQAQDGTDVKHIHQRTKYTEHENLTQVCLCLRLAFLTKFRHLFLFASENLRNLDAGKVFRKISIDIRRRILYPAVCPAGKLPEDHCKDHDEGNKAQHHQRQLIV